MRRMVLILFTAVFLPALSVVCQAADMTSSEWEKYLISLSLAPDEKDRDENWKQLLFRLERAPSTLKRLRETGKQERSRGEYIELLKKMGIEPKKDMPETGWDKLLSKMNLAPSLVQSKVQETAVREKQVPAENENTGEKRNTREERQTISLDIKGLDIIEVLNIFSKKGGFNFIVGKNVQGSVKIFLKDVEIWQALEATLDSVSLACIREESLVRIVTQQEYEQKFGVKFKDLLRVEIITLKHINAEETIKLLAGVKSKAGSLLSDGRTNSLVVMDLPDNIGKIKEMISILDKKTITRIYDIKFAVAEEVKKKLSASALIPPENLQVDERTNKLLVTATPEKFETVEEILKSLDEKTREVLIEARILQVVLGDEYRLGINWNTLFSKAGAAVYNALTPDLKVDGSFNIFTANSPAMSVALGTLGIDGYNLVLNMMESVGKTDVLSSPRIMTTNNQEAKILVGTQEAYVTTTVTTPGTGPITSSENINFKDVGVKLFVTPTINPDGYITMKVRPEVSSVERVIMTAQGNQVPIIRTSQAESSVMLKDGMTMVIGGLIEEKKVDTRNMVPLLGKIPFLGRLFGSTDYSARKVELVIFLTPHIIDPDNAAGAAKK